MKTATKRIANYLWPVKEFSIEDAAYYAFLAVMVFAFAVLILLTVKIKEARADEIPLYKGVLAEAVSEGYQGMYAVTCVYKNRLDKGMKLGCVALKRENLDNWINKNTMESHRAMAKEIVERVFNGSLPDITNGATHYENLKAFGVPYWAKNMQVVAKIGKHTFYKEIKL